MKMYTTFKKWIPAKTWLMLWLLSACAAPERAEERQTEKPTEKKPVFTLLEPAQTSIDFANNLDEDKYRNIVVYQYFYMGGGVAVGDINNDGLSDLFFTGNQVANRLYLNKGNLQFEDITLLAGLRNQTRASWCTGVTMADINNDGWLDIYVCRSGNLQPENRANLLYINNKDKTFTESAARYGLNDPGYSVQATFFDYDQDNDLDVFIVNHGMEYYGKAELNAELKRDPYIADRLYRNDGGKFTDVSQQAGIIGKGFSFGLGTGVADLNHDGLDDIYVANDFFENDYLYLNQGDGTFRESIKDQTRQVSFFSMGVDVADYNNDGLTDIFVLDMAAEDHVRAKSHLAGISQDKYQDFLEKGFHHQYMFNSLQLNQGNGQFSNVARLAGVDETDWSWSALLADYDNDGFKDLFVSNGLRKEVLNNDFVQGMNATLASRNLPFNSLPKAEAEEILSRMPSEKVSNYLYRNTGGLSFENVTSEWGADIPSFSTGSAWGDLDNDGDLELVVNNIDAPAWIYKNNAREITKGNFIKVVPEGPANNLAGTGTRVELWHNGQLQMQQLQPVRGLQSSMEPVLHFGLGKAQKVDSLRVNWPDGRVQMLRNINANGLLRVKYTEAGTQGLVPPASKPRFTEITGTRGLDFTHKDRPFDDFDFERLLPRKFSDNGPPLAVADLNQDGLEDFVAGGAAGMPAAIFLQKADGAFEKKASPALQRHAASEDAVALFFDANGDGAPDLYIGSGSNEFGAGDPRLQDRLYLNDGKGNFTLVAGALPQMQTPTGAVAALDFDQDGDLDIFAGGQVSPGNYPVAPRSYLLQNQNGKFADVTKEKAPALLYPGMVNAALATDLNSDGQADLLLAGEWMPLSLFAAANGELQPAELPLDFLAWQTPPQQTTGWWQSLVGADIDADGDTDILAGNLGLNYRFGASPESPLELFAGDFDRNGSIDPVLGYYQNGQLYPCVERDDLQEQMSFIKSKFGKYSDYARATLADIFTAEALDTALHLQAQMFETVLLRNQGNGRFAVEVLPETAQVSATTAAIARDFTGDGRAELLLAGNLYGTGHQTPRLDAGTGLLLQQTLEQSWQPAGQAATGFFAPGHTKSMVIVQTAKGPVVLVGNHNGKLQAFGGQAGHTTLN